METQIFICTHKDFQIPQFVSDSKDIKYEVMDNRTYGDMTMFGEGTHSWCEVFTQAVVENKITSTLDEEPDYIGFCHYRRYFDIKQPVDEIFKTKKIIVPKPVVIPKSNVFKQYKTFHCALDLIAIREIIAEEIPEYLNTFDETMKQNSMYPFNMFIMPKAWFVLYMHFLYKILGTYCVSLEGGVHQHVADHPQLYLKKFKPNSEIEYQDRLLGFLAERLLNVFINHYFKKDEIHEIPVIQIDDKTK